MLAVHRKKTNACFAGCRDDKVSCCDQGFFVGERYIPSRLNGSECRADSHHADYRCEHDVRRALRGKLDQPLHAHDYLRSSKRSRFQPRLKLACGGLLPHAHHLRPEFSDLLFNKLYIAACRKTGHLIIFICPDDLEGLSSYRTRRTQNHYLAHHFPP